MWCQCHGSCGKIHCIFSSSFCAYCKWSKTGGGKGLSVRLTLWLLCMLFWCEETWGRQYHWNFNGDSHAALVSLLCKLVLNFVVSTCRVAPWTTSFQELWYYSILCSYQYIRNICFLFFFGNISVTRTCDVSCATDNVVTLTKPSCFLEVGKVWKKG